MEAGAGECFGLPGAASNSDGGADAGEGEVQGTVLGILLPVRHPRATHYPLYTSFCTGELNAIRKHKCFLCSPFYVKGVSLGYVGRIKT